MLTSLLVPTTGHCSCFPFLNKLKITNQLRQTATKAFLAGDTAVNCFNHRIKQIYANERNVAEQLEQGPMESTTIKLNGIPRRN